MTEFNKHYKLPLISSHGMFFDANGNHVLDIIDNDFDKPVLTILNGGSWNFKSELLLELVYKLTKIYYDNNEIISIRGWGRLQKLKNGDKIQDKIGEEITELINFSKLSGAK